MQLDGTEDKRDAESWVYYDLKKDEFVRTASTGGVVGGLRVAGSVSLSIKVPISVDEVGCDFPHGRRRPCCGDSLTAPVALATSMNNAMCLFAIRRNRRS